MNDGELNMLVLDLQSATSGQIVLNGPNNHQSQFWMLSPGGFILNGTGGTNMLQTRGPIGLGEGGYFAGAGGWNPTTAQWSLNDQGVITSPEYPGFALSITSATTGAVVNFLPIPESGPTAEMIFAIDPPPIIENILAQPPVQFPQFNSGEEATAFQSINQQLGYTNIRMEYLNQSIDLEPAQISNCVRPDGVHPSVWSTVVEQLQTEIEFVNNVNTLFASYNSFNTTALASQDGTLSQLVYEVGLSEGTTATGVGMALFSNLFFPLLGMIPGCAPLAMLGRAALSAATAVKQVSAAPFSVAVSDLWKTLNDMFTNVEEQLACMQTTVLTDWGKLQAMNTAVAGPLAAPPTLKAAQIITMNQAFTIAAMQILLPAKCQMYTYQEDSDASVPGMTPDYSYAQRVVQVSPETWQATWIADTNAWNTYPSALALQSVFSITGQKWFTDTMSAWPFATCYAYNWNGASVWSAVITITNQTPEMIRLVQPGISNTLIGTFSSASINVPQGSYGVYAPMNITDVTGANTLASFVLEMNLPDWEGVVPTVASISTAPGYGLSTPQCNQGAFQGFRDGYPGTVQMT
ncbi:MAG: hypothetical protein M3Q69_21960, partial [Acidobacteriota bacterium]|nr:hypothetical protein [Acidobacteriota bacterium]